jgi:hypothetical protein
MGRLGVLPADVPAFSRAAPVLRPGHARGPLLPLRQRRPGRCRAHRPPDRPFPHGAGPDAGRGIRSTLAPPVEQRRPARAPEARDGVEMNLARPGLALYGLQPAPWLRPPRALEPVLSWKTAVGAPQVGADGDAHLLREHLDRAAGPPRIATLPWGTPDGWSRLLSNRGTVPGAGRRGAVVGPRVHGPVHGGRHRRPRGWRSATRSCSSAAGLGGPGRAPAGRPGGTIGLRRALRHRSACAALVVVGVRGQGCPGWAGCPRMPSPPDDHL